MMVVVSFTDVYKIKPILDEGVTKIGIKGK